MCYYIGWKWNPALLIDEIRLNDVPFSFAGAWLFLIRFVTPIMVIIVSFTGFFSIYQTIFP